MIHKLEALHLEALCEEVRRCRILLSGCGHAVLVAVWRSHWSVFTGPAAKSPEAF